MARASCLQLPVQERTQVNFGQLGNLKACILVAKQRARLASKKTLEGKSGLEASNAWKHELSEACRKHNGFSAPFCTALGNIVFTRTCF